MKALDIRNLIFKDQPDEAFIAHIRPERTGVLSGVEDAVRIAEEIGLKILHQSREGDVLVPGKPIFTISGTPLQLAIAEERMIGALAKTSGIATSAREFADKVPSSMRVVCGAWKKVPENVRAAYRKAITTGGCGIRVLDEPMIYLDKNYVIMMGGVTDALKSVKGNPDLAGRKIVIQIKDWENQLEAHCWAAASYGADVIYLDTGREEDLERLKAAVEYMRHVPTIAFGGNITMDAIERLKNTQANILGVGKAIIDAPMLDMKLDVLPKAQRHECEQKRYIRQLMEKEKL